MSDIIQIQESLERLQAKTKRAQIFTFVIYAIIILIFVIYSVMVPKVTGQVLNPKTGSSMLLDIVEEKVPSNDEIMMTAKTKLPEMITGLLDETENKIPIFEEALNDITETSLAGIVTQFSTDIKPLIKAAVESHNAEIKQFVESSQDEKAVEDLYKALNEDLDKELLAQTKNLARSINIYADKLRTLAAKAPMTQQEKAKRDFLMAYAQLSSLPHFEESLAEIIKETLGKMSF